MTIDRSGEWLAPVTPLHRATVESVDDTDDIEYDTDDSNDVDVQTIAVRALARKAMSVREMEKLLRERDANPDDIDAEVARLESVGLLNDDDLAADLANEMWVGAVLPVRLILTERFDAISKIGSVRIPTLILEGDADRPQRPAQAVGVGQQDDRRARLFRAPGL